MNIQCHAILICGLVFTGAGAGPGAGGAMLNAHIMTHSTLMVERLYAVVPYRSRVDALPLPAMTLPPLCRCTTPAVMYTP